MTALEWAAWFGAVGIMLGAVQLFHIKQVLWQLEELARRSRG